MRYAKNCERHGRGECADPQCINEQISRHSDEMATSGEELILTLMTVWIVGSARPAVEDLHAKIHRFREACK